MFPFSKAIGVLSILAAIFGALNTAEILTVVGPKVGGVIAAVATLTAALSRALVDADGDGIPDAFQRRNR